MRRGGAAALDPHEPRAPDHRAERGEHLADVGAAGEEWRGPHRPLHVVIDPAADGDERQRRIPRVPLRMRAPFGLGELEHLLREPRGIETEGQLVEFAVEVEHGAWRGLKTRGVKQSAAKAQQGTGEGGLPIRSGGYPIAGMKRKTLRGLYAPELLESRIAPATFTVTSLLDDGTDGALLTLREAIVAANLTATADTIVFKAGLTGEISLAMGQMVITTPLSIVGPGAGKLIIDAGLLSRIFAIDDGAIATASKVSISRLAMVNGNTAGSGGAILSTEALSLKNCVLSGNIAGNDGGALYIQTAGSGTAGLTIDGSSFVNNTAGDTGGAFKAAVDGSVKITNSLVAGNTAANGSGGFRASVLGAGTGDVFIGSTTIIGNKTTSLDGGGADLRNIRAGGKVTVKASAISDNSAAGGHGGGLQLTSGITLIDGSVLSGNIALNGGGGIHDSGTTALTVSKTRLLSNQTTDTASDGGGLLTTGDHVVKVLSSTLSGNIAGADGGGIAALGLAKLTVQSSTLSGNSTGTDTGTDIGGGISGETGASIRVVSSIFTDNRAAADGGGIGVEGTGANAVSLEVLSSTFSRNVTGNDGGGIRLMGDGNLKVTGSKFIGNVVAFAGGGLYARTSGTVVISSSLFQRNVATFSKGGGLYLGGTGAKTVTSCIIKDNTAGSQGGGIFLDEGLLTIKSSTITGNIAKTAGGGVFNDSATPITLVATVIANNVAPLNPNKSGLFLP